MSFSARAAWRQPWLAALLWLCVGLSALAGAPGTELVLVLDNSCSMIAGTTRRPAADPLRQSVLGALVVEGLTRDSDDHLTVLSFDAAAPDKTQQLVGYQAIREIQDGHGTFYLGPLARARQVLDASERDHRFLLFLSDGAPNDTQDPRDGPRTLGLPDVSYDTLIIGLLPQTGASQAAGFLTPLALDAEDYVELQDGADLVAHFTQAYARSLGSKALTGTLSPGDQRSFRVGKYVTEVMVIAASTTASGPFEARHEGPDGPIAPRAVGDNGCSFEHPRNKALCTGPRMHFAVWRTPHDPLTESSHRIALDAGRGEIVYGILLRYDLSAQIDLPERARQDDPVPVRAHLSWRGQIFDDLAFFEQDDFSASAVIAGQQVQLSPGPDGVFTGVWVPTEPSSGQRVPASVEFRNAWMAQRAHDGIVVEGYLPLSLRPGPAELDFGHWRGARQAQERCLDLDLSASINARRIPLDVQFIDISDAVALSFVPLDMADAGAAREGLQPLRWRACLTVRGCCGDISSSPTAALQLRGRDPHYHDQAVLVPVRYDIERTGFFRCWWPWLLALALLLLLIWLIVGWVRPHDFDPALTIRVAGSERQLDRAASMVLRELPRGRRGFYRNARVCLTASGDFVASPRRCAVWVEAQPADDVLMHPNLTVERKDRRTRKWVAVSSEEAADGLRLQTVYRCGGILFRFQ